MHTVAVETIRTQPTAADARLCRSPLRSCPACRAGEVSWTAHGCTT